MPRFPSLRDPRLWLAAAAAAGPTLLAYNLSPSATFLNQALAVALWGWFVVALCAPLLPGLRAARAPVAAVLVLCTTVLASWWLGALPASLAWSAIAVLASALVVLLHAAGQDANTDLVDAFALFAWGWLAAGVLNVAIALIQVFHPAWADGDLIAISGIAGRAVGNLRQPNHLSSVLLWSSIAVVALLELRRLPVRLAAVLLAATVLGVVLTASRTGLVSVVLLAVWGLLDRRLSPPARLMLLAAPLVYALAWWGMAAWANASQHVFGGQARLAETDISASRFAIWRDTLALIREQPLWGVGFGEFNFAWTLTALPQRPVAFFDHAHNLPLQLAAEIGLPLATLVCGLLVWSMVRGARLAWQATGELSVARRAAWMMVLMIGLHSLLEYPLWYTYFLLPAAWAWGAMLARPSSSSAPAGSPWALQLAGVALVVGGIASVWDYSRVVAIFEAPEGGASLEQRIEAGRHSVLFAHHADYAAATTLDEPTLDLFDRPSHYLLDTRLMMAWARALERNGQGDKARFIAARLREFRNSASAEFFADCTKAVEAPASAASASFQCAPPQALLGWRDFKAH